MICYKKCLRYGSFFILYLHLKKNILSTQKQEKALSKDDIYNTFLLTHPGADPETLLTGGGSVMEQYFQ